MRHIREEFALRLIRPLHVTIEPLEFNRSSCDMKRALLLPEKTECQEEHAGDAERPHTPPQRLRRKCVCRIDGPGPAIRQPNERATRCAGERATTRPGTQ